MGEERPSMGTAYEVEFLEKIASLAHRYAEEHREEFEKWKKEQAEKEETA